MANNRPESRLIKAAGAVAWRSGPDGEPEILLVHRKKYGDWSLPKGKVDHGEPLPLTAVREVLEEGGARITLGRRLLSVKYQVGGRPKRVHYWASRVTGTDPAAVPNSEVDQVAWVTVEQAWEQLSYGHDVTILEDFARTGIDTFPLILLRHAKAEGKSGWKHDDMLRPLDDTGRADAKALADLLACFAPTPRLVSSPAVRCVDTLRPLAEFSGAPVQEAPALYIRHKSDATGAADPATLIADAIASGQPTVLCAHRENIPELQAAALAALGRSDAPTGIRYGAEPPLGPARERKPAAYPRRRTEPGQPESGDEPLADPVLDEFILPRDWLAPLAPASFWVLHLTRPQPVPAAASGIQVPGSGQVPGPVAAVGTRPGLRQRLRLRWLAGRTDPAAQATPLPGPAAAQGTPLPEPTAPPVTLVAADLYLAADC